MRIINSGGFTVFMVSKPRVLFFLALEIAVAYWIFTILKEKDLSWAALLENRHTGILIFLGVILAVLCVITASTLFFEKAYSLKMDADKLTLHSFFSTYVWPWKDIDRLHLGESLKSPPMAEAALFQVLLYKLLKLKPLHLRFEDVLYNTGKTNRLNLKPEPDGYVSLPLSLFGNAEEIFKTADHYHLEWHRRHNKQ